jgi:hypothetical protein
VIFEKKVPLLSCSGRRRRHGQLNSLYLARVQAAGGGLNVGAQPLPEAGAEPTRCRQSAAGPG